MNDHRSFEVTKSGQVATIRIIPLRLTAQLVPPPDVHAGLPDILEQLRIDDNIRVIILTGAQDGEFLVTRPKEFSTQPQHVNNVGDPFNVWPLTRGVIRCFQAMTEIEKPIVAKVNGDAIAFGQSLVFGCDIIIAREDALLSDAHLGMGEVMTSVGKQSGPPYGVVPGDGAGALIPLFMTPAKAKEYMMLSVAYTAGELAAMNIINRAVPAERLDAVTDDYVARLLKRSAFALGWTKRILNRHVAQQLNLTLDSGIAYEMLNLAQLHRMGFNDPTSLVRPAAD